MPLAEDEKHDVYVLVCTNAMTIFPKPHPERDWKYRVRGWERVYADFNAAHGTNYSYRTQDILKDCFREKFLHTMSFAELNRLKDGYSKEAIIGRSGQAGRAEDLIADKEGEDGEVEIIKVMPRRKTNMKSKVDVIPATKEEIREMRLEFGLTEEVK